MSDLRLDRSKYFSTVHGDRTPEDPHFRVAFLQDGLPFDCNGELVPDDGRTEPWEGNGDGRRIWFTPLYDAPMRERLAKKKERLARRPAKPGAPQEPEQEADQADAVSKADAGADEVDLVAWLKGQRNYDTYLLFAAARKRFSIAYSKLGQLVEDLVLDHKLIDERELAPRLARLLTNKPA
ncbi:MAG: hypothetical protein ACLPKB_24715 [Xanthobacteraceae bacterium]